MIDNISAAFNGDPSTPPIIHIGMHKTGTTSIQSLISSLSVPGYIQFFKDPDPFLQSIVDRLCFDPYLSSSFFRDYKHLFSSVKFLSSETLCGVREDLYKGSFLFYMPQYIKQLFGSNAHILITYRDPISIISSTYLDSILYGASLSFDQWWSLLESRGWDTFWRLDKIYSAYKSHFSNVSVVPLSNILSSPLEDFLSFLNLSLDKSDLDAADNLFVSDILPQENISPSLLSARIQRSFVNRFFVTKNTKWHHVGKCPDAKFYHFYRYYLSTLIDRSFSSQKATSYYRNYFISHYINSIEDRLNAISDIPVRSF